MADMYLPSTVALVVVHARCSYCSIGAKSSTKPLNCDPHCDPHNSAQPTEGTRPSAEDWTASQPTTTIVLTNPAISHVT